MSEVAKKIASSVGAASLAKSVGKNSDQAKKIIEETVDRVSQHMKCELDEAGVIVEKALTGGESELFGLTEWFDNRLVPNTVFITERGYSEMCIDALKILSTTAGTDYGSSRQRDMGQMWADMTRGYLGELAFKQLLEEKYQVRIELGHEVGNIEDYLPSDIRRVVESDGTTRDPRIKVGIKATKWNGIWFDLPGDQFRHSDVHVLVKVGTGRNHLFSFFKSLNIFKDKILKRGEEIGHLTEGESRSLLDSLPNFRSIPAYICGFASVGPAYQRLDYAGKKGRTNFTISKWCGPINPGDLEIVKHQESAKKTTFESIGAFSHEKGFLFNTGSLKWKKEDWNELIERI
jgi:hypothetical protein